MAAKPLDIHPAALEETKSAVSWYLEHSESAAQNFAAELDRAAELIQQTPERWPRGELKTRRFVLQRFPYAVIYREREADIQILAIAHGSRRPQYWKKRLRS
jgi:plasmid stabilization system protein ParE